MFLCIRKSHSDSVQVMIGLSSNNKPFDVSLESADLNIQFVYFHSLHSHYFMFKWAFLNLSHYVVWRIFLNKLNKTIAGNVLFSRFYLTHFHTNWESFLIEK